MHVAWNCYLLKGNFSNCAIVIILAHNSLVISHLQPGFDDMNAKMSKFSMNKMKKSFSHLAFVYLKKVSVRWPPQVATAVLSPMQQI